MREMANRRSATWTGLASKAHRYSPPPCTESDEEPILFGRLQTAFLAKLTSNCNELSAACSIAKDFAGMIRQRDPERFDGWRQQVNATNVPELVAFANSIDRDRHAVIAGITLPWSNGQKESDVNRLKSIKRQMYGRAGFEMLRKRMLVPP